MQGKEDGGPTIHIPQILRCGIIEHRDRPPDMYTFTELKH